MHKKLVLVLLMAILHAGGAFAQNYMSVGFGGTFTGASIVYTWTDINDPSWVDKNILNRDIVGGGFFAYFDAIYAMWSLGMSFHDISYQNPEIQKVMNAAKVKQSLITLDIGLLGKFPIRLGATRLFPMLGVDLKIAVAQDMIVDGTKYTYEDLGRPGTVVEYYSTIWAKLGIGMDIPLGKKLYLRPILLGGIGTVPKWAEEHLYNMSIAYGAKVADIVYWGMDVKLAIGIKL